MEHLFQRAHDLCRAESWRCRGVDLRAAVEVEAHRELGAGDVAYRGQRRQRDRLPILVAHVELADILDVGAEVPLGLDVDLPLAAEAVEIVDEATAEEGLQGLVDLLDVDPLLEHLVAVHVDEQLRHDRAEGGRQAGEFRSLARRFEELAGLLGEEGDVLAGAVLQDEGGAARDTDALDCRRRKGEADGTADAGKPPGQLFLDRPVLLFRLRALRPFLESDEEESAVGVLHLAQQVVADHSGGVLDAGNVLDQVFGLAGDFRGALQRTRVGKLHAGEDVTLVLVGQEAGRQRLAEQAGEGGEAGDEDQADEALAERQAADADIAAGDPAENLVEPVVELLQRPASLDLGTQQQGAQGRAQGQRVERRDDDRNRDGHRELLVELAGDAGNEGGRHEDCGEDDGDGDDRAGHLAHRLEGRVLRRQALLDVVFDRLDDDDGVVDDQTDRQDQTEQRQGVDREAEQREEHEGADQRHRHGEQRDKRRAPALQEDEDDDDHQHQRLEQRVLDLLDAFGDGQCRVEGDDVVEVGRETLLDLFHQCLGAVRGIEGVGSGDLVEGDEGRRLAVQPPFHVVGLGAEFDPGNV
ncbi:MAG: hypothetical protein AW08_02975 [Candidatus Accumulibacter adjunctus]|uniref:Uncharacterized protein n=1 Tax=Candidatus Accumulibacter adjunctus TaxID=1454001 RepID=A0A011M7U6_9PROT|nr:MAG: hypothetical protein AW08_02975 [Candidatus Accumulibacter adjunctus]